MIRAVTILSALSILGSTRAELVKNVENYLVGDPKGSKLQVVTPEIREEVIMRLRRTAYGFDSDTGAKMEHRNKTALLVLLRLGDVPTIEDVMREYHETPGEWEWEKNRSGVVGLLDGTFPDSAQPLLIPYLAREFFREDLHTADDEVMEREGFPGSVGSAFYAIGIMKKSPVFNAPVRKWAEKADWALRLHTGRDIVKYREVMQQWWWDNAKHFEAKDYGAVQPGAPLVTTYISPGPLPPEVVERTGAKVSPDAAAIEASTAGVKPQSASTTEEATHEIARTSSEWTFVAIAAGCLVLLGGLLVFWRRRPS